MPSSSSKNRRTVLAPVNETSHFTLPKEVVKILQEEPKLRGPQTTAEWVHLTLRVLNRELAVAPERTALLCQEVVRFVLDDAESRIEKEETEDQERGEGVLWQGGDTNQSPSPPPGSTDQHPVLAAATNLAVEILAARAMVGVEMETLSEAEVAQEMAKTAYELDSTNALAILAYAYSSYHVGRRSLDRAAQHSSQVLTMQLAEEGLQLLYQKITAPPLSGTTLPLSPQSSAVSNDVRYGIRLAWFFCAGGGELNDIRPYLFILHQHSPNHFLLMLLIAIMNTIEDGDEEALGAAMEQLENLYGDHIAVLLLSAALHRTRCRDPLPDGRDKAATLVVAAISRLEMLSNGLFGAVREPPQGNPLGTAPRPKGNAKQLHIPLKPSSSPAPQTASIKLQTFQQLATPDAPGESKELQVRWRRTTMYWSLVAHISCRIGCYTIADTAVEAGLTLLTAAPRFYPFAYAHLLVSKVESLLCKWAEKHCSEHLAGTLSEPTSILQALIASPLQLHQPVAALTGDWLLDGAGELGNNEDEDDAENGGAERQDFVSSQNTAGGASAEGMGGLVLALEELRSFPQYLIKAIDADPANSMAFYYLGYLKVLEGIYADLPSEQRELIFSEGSHYLTQALHRAPTMAAASYALGCVHMAQGDSTSALNFFSSALEAAERAPVLSLNRFLFLLER